MGAMEITKIAYSAKGGGNDLREALKVSSDHLRNAQRQKVLSQ